MGNVSYSYEEKILEQIADCCRTEGNNWFSPGLFQIVGNYLFYTRNGDKKHEKSSWCRVKLPKQKEV